MAEQFSKLAGPTGPSDMQFGNLGRHRPPSPSPPLSPPVPRPIPAPSPRSPEAIVTLRSPSMAHESPGLAAGFYQSSGIPRRPEAVQRVRSPPMDFQSTNSASKSPSPAVGAQRPIGSSHGWINAQRSILNDNGQTNPRSSTVTSFVASHNSGNRVTAKIGRFQDLKRAALPHSHFSDGDISTSSTQTLLQNSSDLIVDNGNHFPSRTRSPPLAFENNPSANSVRPHFGQGQHNAVFVSRPVLSPSQWGNQPKFPRNSPSSLVRQDQSSTSPYVASHDAGRVADVRAPKRTRSPPVQPNEGFKENTHFLQNESKRPSVSPPILGATSDALFSTSDSQLSERNFPSAHHAASEFISTRTSNFSVAKRTLSPPLLSSDKGTRGNSFSTHDGTEREMQAKAKRLARFKKELSEYQEDTTDMFDQNVSASTREPTGGGQNFAGYNKPAESAPEFTNGNISSDLEGMETSNIIVGLCPDMCPASERAERERKGDLDYYERLDGDRNQTNKFLAVKKYTRTAEREARLIRPMPILQNTVDYLLHLLDQPYDDRFLGMYNFLWDRMRAIRMDLRMQHIFNQEAITMLEQMIRLHIIAMHELCEYTKGEGFSEGFDAHLNIEQMNKTSVELFQLYDDHRKKGINVPSEHEFRGYYALLKLDKHPGYKVEPAELSLDLAKMTKDIRQTPEVLFARDVARACRTGNFIAFFRLARKATYLQACLMHTHFAKLRTQALASLHSGLQNNQGLPVSHVANWLAMEDENIESLLEYHGFSIKEFEEPYMVKEGPFLNGDKDYTIKCSKLVHLKKSRRIMEDVSPPSQMLPLPAEASKEIQLPKIYEHDTKFVSVSSGERKSIIDEKMPDVKIVSSPKADTQVQPVIRKPMFGHKNQDDQQVVGAPISPWGFPFAHGSPKHQPTKLTIVEKPAYDYSFRVSPEKKMPTEADGISFQVVPSKALQAESPGAKHSYTAENNFISQSWVNNVSKDEPPKFDEQSENDEVEEYYEDEEVSQAKLKLIIRLWRRRSSKLKELREQRQMAANAAMSSLSLGPPIRQTKEEPTTSGEFDIDGAMRERYKKLQQSWSKLNVSDVVADILGIRNPGAVCICWKVILCSQINNKEGCSLRDRSRVMHVTAGPWLTSKLMPSKKDSDEDSCDDDLLISSSGLSIWKKWVPSQPSYDLTCCFSVVKDVNFDNLIETAAGASAVIFLVSETIPLDLQRIQLQKLLSSIPSGSCLPLLVLSGSCNKEVSDPASIIVSGLGLLDIDKSRVRSFLVVFLVGDEPTNSLDGFFSDTQLREGLQWLANESPPQPGIHCVKMRELVLSYVNPSLDFLEKTSGFDVGPNHCISAFNEALDWSIGELATAVKANPTRWPCPEIGLLEHLCNEDSMMVKWYLPSIGWSSMERVEQLLCALRDCKLPDFPQAIPWLDEGAITTDAIENLRLRFENCLIGYLTQSSGMMGLSLAMKEANVMLQGSSRLELHDSTFYIMPKWVMIFRRIINWRLTSLSSGDLSTAYVLRHNYADPTLQTLDGLRLEGSVSAPYFSLPSLDEMIEVGCSPLILAKGQPQPEPFQPSPRTFSSSDNHFDANTGDSAEDDRTAQNGNLPITDGGNLITNVLNNNTHIAITDKANGEANKLSRLLEQCNIMQNSIEKKLSIYF